MTTNHGPTPTGALANVVADHDPLVGERTRRLIPAAAATAAVSIAAAAIVLFTGQLPLPGAALAWFVFLAVLCSGPIGLWYVQRRWPDRIEARPRFWSRVCVIAAALLGLAWAALPAWLWPIAPQLDLLLSVAIAGLALGCGGALAVSGPALFGLVAPPVVVVIALHASRGSAFDFAVAALFAFGGLALVPAQRFIAARFRAAAAARSRSDELMSRLRRADAALQATVAEQKLLFDLAAVGVLQARKGLVTRVNAHLTTMLGCAEADVIGRPLRALLPADAVEDELSSGARKPSFHGELQLGRRNGSAIWVHVSSRLIDADDAEHGVIMVLADISDRRERESALQRLAHEDVLTGLPNRRLLQDRMRLAFVQAERRGRLMAVLLIDIDSFKKINDNYGHEVGDEVLIAVARRLTAGVRGSDTVSRIGGDEFVVLLDDPGRGEDAQLVAEKLIESIAQPIRSGTRMLMVTASVGICMFPRDAQDVEAMLRRADAAVFRAKRAGREAWRLHGEAAGSAS